MIYDLSAAQSITITRHEGQKVIQIGFDLTPGESEVVRSILEGTGATDIKDLILRIVPLLLESSDAVVLGRKTETRRKAGPDAIPEDL